MSLSFIMDMPTPKALDAKGNTTKNAAIDRLAETLNCTPDLFFEAAHGDKGRDTAQLLQMWLSIENVEHREIVFALVRDVWRSEKEASHCESGL